MKLRLNGDGIIPQDRVKVRGRLLNDTGTDADMWPDQNIGSYRLIRPRSLEGDFDRERGRKWMREDSTGWVR